MALTRHDAHRYGGGEREGAKVRGGRGGLREVRQRSPRGGGWGRSGKKAWGGGGYNTIPDKASASKWDSMQEQP